MIWFIFILLATQLHGEEVADLPGNITTTTTTTSTTVAPEVLLVEINKTETTSALAPSPTTTELPVALIGNATLDAANETTATIVVPITIVIQDNDNATTTEAPALNGTAGLVASENYTTPKISEIPSFIIVEILSDVTRGNSSTTTTPTPTPTPTPAPILSPIPFLDGDKLNPVAINYILSQNVSENLVEDFDEIDAWEAPLELQRAFPYYLTGFDYENRPIWVSEWGKFNLRKIVEGGNRSIEEFNRYARKAVRIITKSHDLKSTTEDPVTQAAFIVDFDGLQLDQYAHIPTVMYALDLAREHKDIIEKHASRVVIVNTNFIAEAAINLGRNVFGRLFERVEVFGTDKSRWAHHLRRIFPADQIPEWYGGTNKAHKPLFVYGK